MSSNAKKLMQNKNVAGGQLGILSTDPPTGFYRDGYCRTGPEDKGNHSVAATVNKEFLDFTDSKGNNLKKSGVKDGMKWCLCATRWKEAMEAAQTGKLSQSAVPRVHLHASHESALKEIKYGDLSKYAAQGEAPKSDRSRQDTHHDPASSKGIAKTSTDISGNSETTGGVGVRTSKDGE
ncbi:hypothetical protein A1O1_01938 [Capronia coronata CBS 617.96]|uniref:Uncharacterized protein n=1 Tax=Capronia coronata CBS 617.96 TaxID=1182541 RepID=W9YW98_9EURO|nr:uncharacterized protein A1O1_01938 [Capronia coronata CBS 617.96]EXJ93546.1 hypothetical protein A1O1_01938 [Capronia coronata CBS 617.96]